MSKIKSIGKLKRILKIDETKLDIYLRYYNQEVEATDLTPTQQARYLFEETKFIHGKLDQVDRDGRQSASIAFYDLIANMALKEKNLEAAVKARERGDDLARLNEPEDVGLDPADFMKVSKFVFVNNVNVYKKQLDLDE